MLKAHVEPAHTSYAPVRRSTQSARGLAASSASVVALQRSLGNRAVAQLLAGRQPGGQRLFGTPRVQRCGPWPCDCSVEERAEEEAAPARDEAKSTQGIQRLA